MAHPSREHDMTDELDQDDIYREVLWGDSLLQARRECALDQLREDAFNAYLKRGMSIEDATYCANFKGDSL